MYIKVKRVIDFILAIALLILFAIPMMIVAICIKIDSEGPVFFKQERTGKDGKIFKLYKFRSMTIENDVRDFSKSDEHTKVGMFLRKTSLDELGQLINILKGEMSFIGPRPWIPEYYKYMNEEQRHRCDVLPGITGLAQCKGRNNISINEKINYDLKYINNYSLIEDIKIIFLTVRTVVEEKGCDAGKSTIQNELEELQRQNKYLKSQKQNNVLKNA